MKKISLTLIVLFSFQVALAGDYVSASDFGKETQESQIPKDAIPAPAKQPQSRHKILQWSGLAVAFVSGSIALWQIMRVSDANDEKDKLKEERDAALESNYITNSSIANLVRDGYDRAIDNQEKTADQAKTASTVALVFTGLGLVGFGISFAF